MRPLLALATGLLLTLCTGTCMAQKEAFVWYFGTNLGLDFNFTPPRVLTDGRISFQNYEPQTICESAASIADRAGNLLFYTDGLTVWARDHSVMPNGTGLLGYCTTTQTLIVSVPNSANLYYIFTATPQGNYTDEFFNPTKGFYYSLVDMELNNGLGEVISKNIKLTGSTTEKIAGTHHANGRDVWVLMHEWENDIFRAYLITKNGLQQNPVMSRAGRVHSGGRLLNLGDPAGDNATGQMKFSPDGRTIALAILAAKRAEIFDFDNLMGKVYFRDSLTNFTSDNPAIYGVEFSPSGRFLYLNDAFRQVMQFDLLAQTINESKVLLKDESDLFQDEPGAMQLGPDGRIYIAKRFKNFAGIISYPDIKGTGCQYLSRGIELGPPFNWESLPNFLSSYFFDPTKYPDKTSFELPNVFTPNGDGYNDMFVPYANYNVETSLVRIFNRWGELIREITNQEEGWDGVGSPSGVYFWQASYRGVDGKVFIKKGWVQLIR